jgi:pimeloyl-ACP methyl ester carboxylesterase
LSKAALRWVLLPGLDGTGRLFEPFLQVLPAECRPIVVSYPADRFVGYEELALHAQQSLPVDAEYVLVAESFSGPVAAIIAGSLPRALRAVVFVGSFAWSPLPQMFRWLSPAVRSLSVWPSRSRMVLRTLLVGWDCQSDLLEQVQSVVRSVPSAVLAERLRLVLNSRQRWAADNLDVPVLYLVGDRDRLVGKRGLRTVQILKPGAVITHLDAPHLLLQTKPKEALEAIEDFLHSRLPAPETAPNP